VKQQFNAANGKAYSFPVHISRFVLVLLRQRRGAAATTWAPSSSSYKNNKPQASV
jgi:hypothetical protein